MKKIVFLLVFAAIGAAVLAQSPKRELRGAWLTTVFNIDWPSSSALTPQQERDQLVQRLDFLKATGVNMVFFQVRSQCDAIYPSTIEPWAALLTGSQGTPPSPFYDPLQFCIDECRKRGLEIHAWLNPYRALSTATTSTLAALHPTHIINTQPTWIMSAITNSNSSDQRLLNPGNPNVPGYIISVVMDIVRRYDVDGIHFDDYFYPNPATVTYNDDNEYNANPRGITVRNDWRRANVDTLIKRTGDSIRSVKPWVKFGVSPSGIWMSVANNPLGSNTSAGALQHFRDLMANSRLWIQNNWVDYLIPQNYWATGFTGSDYSILTPWWNNNAFSRHMYMGMAAYKVGVTGNGNLTSDRVEIPRQVRLNRSQTNVTGSVLYSYRDLVTNNLNFRDSLINLFRTPALYPAMAWKDNTPPPAVNDLTADFNFIDRVNLRWTVPTTSGQPMDAVRQFAIYRSTSSPVDITNTANLIGVTNRDTTGFQDILPNNGTYFYVVTALDRLHNESPVSNTASLTVATLPVQLGNFWVTKTQQGAANVQWQTVTETNTKGFAIEVALPQSSSFRQVGFVNAKGTGASYLFPASVQNCEDGWYQFRLKMIDNDGSFTYSPVRSVQLCANGKLSILPTVVKAGGVLQINVDDVQPAEKINFQLVDAVGRVVMSQEWQGNSLKTIAVPSNLATGTYQAKVLKAGQPFTQNIFIQP